MTSFVYTFLILLSSTFSNYVVTNWNYVYKDLSPHIRLHPSETYRDDFGDFRLSAIGGYNSRIYSQGDFLVKSGSKYIAKINYIIPPDGNPKNKYEFVIDQYLDSATTWKVLPPIKIDLGHKVYNKLTKLIHIDKNATSIRVMLKIETEEYNTIGDLIIKEFKMDLVGAKNNEP